LTAVGTLKNSTLQSCRNLVSHFMLGFEAVQQAFADAMTEVKIGYANSPLNAHSGNSHGGPKPGERAPIRDGEPPVGAGGSPFFALFASDSPASRTLRSKYSELLEPLPRSPYADKGIWLVRPDGYVALTANEDGVGEVDAYLANLSKPISAANRHAF
jgi:hypothetical protein